LEKSLREEVSGIIIASYDNEKRIFANVPIKSIGWSAGAGVRENVVMEPIFTTLLHHGAAFSIITFLTFMVALVISRTISSPVERLRAHARVLGNGEFGKRIDPTGPVEMQALAQTFNAMAEQINESHEELRESEQRWATTVASIGDGIITTDVVGRITFMNAIAESLTGWKLNEASQKPVVEVFNIINEHTRQKVESPVAKVLEKGNIIGLANHTILVRKDGKEVPIDDSGAPIRDLNGKTTGVVLVFRDITERKRAEDELREAHARAIWLARFPEENPNPVLRASREGSILYCNPAARRLPGWKCEVGCPLPETVLRQTVQALQEEKETDQELELAGRLYTVWTSPFPAEGYVNIYGRDITKRKQAEEMLRKERDFSAAVLDTAGALVVVLDKEGRIIRFNRACEAITGYLASEVLGRVFWEFLVPAEEMRGVLQTWETLQSGDFPNKYENRWVAKDGSMRLIAWTNTAIVRPGGEVEHIIGTGLDITERKHREFRIARLTKLYAVLSQVNEAIVRIHEEGRLYGEVCRIVAEQGGFPLVWIGQVQGKQIVREASCGPAAAYLKEIRVETEGELGSGPTGTCVREDRPAINDDFDINPSTSPWRKPALRFGFRASAAFPLHRQGKVVGVFTLYAAEPGAFDQEQVNLLEALCADVSYALDAMQQEQMRNRAEEALRLRTLELQQLTATLEQRVYERTEDLEKSQQRLQQLASQLIHAQEKERKRVANELHDSLLSELAAMKFLFEGKLMLFKKGQLGDPKEFDRITELMQKVMKEARGIMNNLRPSILDEVGLIPTIDWHFREYQKVYDHIQIRKQVEVLEKDIPDVLKIVIFRVLQEALNNFAKHGKGDFVDLSLWKSGNALHLRIQDNGQGFDMGGVQKGLGLESMRERVEVSLGSFHIESSEGKGTLIQASWHLLENR
jgi:PAS domain S-box-containing protein